MDLDALGASPVGQLVPISGTDARLGEFEYWAFLPDSLPDEVHLTSAAWTAVAAAAAALGKLQQACIQLPNPQLLITPALIREAMDTSALEGTFGELPEVLEARLPGVHPKSPETIEIRAYEDMANHGFDMVRADRQISTSMLCELQGILAAGSREIPRDPGIVRTHQVFIGPRDAQGIQDARYIPPPPDDRLLAGLDQLEDWINRPHDLPAIAKAALAHYQFESLHPFGDGNGRVGRLSVILQLMQGKVIDYPALTVSQWFLRRRESYQQGLLRVSQTGDFSSWVVFFCSALQEQAERSVACASELLSWLTTSRGILNERHWSGMIMNLLETLVEWPVLSMSAVAQRFEVSSPTAKSAVDRLVSVGILEELTGRSYGRVFGARTVMRLVESM